MVLDPRLARWRAGSRSPGKDRPRRGLRRRRRLQGGTARRPQRLVPTYQARPRFLRDYKNLTREQAAAWDSALDLFIACLRRGRFEPGLRVKRVQGYPGVWELTWAPNGRATFEYGDELRPGDPHIVWRRIGTHGIFRKP